MKYPIHILYNKTIPHPQPMGSSRWTHLSVPFTQQCVTWFSVTDWYRTKSRTINTQKNCCSLYCSKVLMFTGLLQITLLRVIPTMAFIHFVTGKSSGILSDISSGILSGILSGISSGILPGILSGILSGIPSGILLAYYLAFYLACYLAYLLAFYLTFYLAYLLAFYLANLLAFSLA